MFQAGMKRGLFVQPFIWQRNCKKRDLFNGSFSSQLRALVGCNGFSNDWDTLIHTDLNINCLVSSDYHAVTTSLSLWRNDIFLPQNKTRRRLLSRLNLPQKPWCFSKSGTKRCKWKFIVFQLCFFLTQWCPVARSPQHSWHRLKRLILKYHYDLPTWCGPAIFSPDWSWWFADAAAAGGGGTIYHEERERERRPWHWSQWLHSVLSQ